MTTQTTAMSVSNATPGNIRRSIRSERILMFASSLMVIVIVSSMTLWLSRERTTALQVATRVASTIVQLVTTDMRRHVEQDLSHPARRDDTKNVPATMPLSDTSKLLKGLDIGRTGSLNLLSRDGILLAQEPPQAEDLIGKDVSQQPNFARILREGNGSFTGVGADQTSHLFTFAQAGDLPLTVVVTLSSQDVYASWKRIALLISSTLGALCIGLLCLAALLCREMRRRHNAEHELAQLTAIDPLTDLANRRALDNMLQREWLRAQRSGQPLSMLMINADHFKTFNDRHGYPRGDEALQTLARLINGHIRRPADLAARHGSDTFCVVLPETTTAGALSIAQHIREAVEQLSPAIPGDAPLTVSIGIATWVQGSYNALEQFQCAADKALYQAKVSGRNRVVCAM